jgi:excisionase family DNA binding protein
MTREPALDGLVRVPEAARFLGLTRSKLYLLMESRELPFIKIGKCRRIARAALLEFVTRHTVSGRDGESVAGT